MKRPLLISNIILAASTATASAQTAANGANTALPQVEIVTQKPKAAPAKSKAKPKTPAPAPAATAPPPAAEVETASASAPAAAGSSANPTAAAKPTMSGPEILAAPGATITDALADRPGIDGSNFAPGANRPILRGLDNNRIRIQENGVGTGDVSAISEDHAFPIDPCAAEKVEIIRGPEALRFGSTAVGGIVSVENGRIPTAMPRNGISSEVSGGLGSADQGREGCAKATAGSGNVVVHADTFARRTRDYDTPLGRQANSAVDTIGYAAGASYVTSQGFAGFSFTRFESLYGIPGEEGAEERARIDMGQDKWNGRMEWKIGALGIDVVRGWIGFSDYAHNEVVFDAALGADAVGANFTNREIEGKIEIQHVPVVTAAGLLSGMLGITTSDRKLAGLSSEGDNLLEPNTTEKMAAYIYEDLALTQRLHLLGAARIDQSNLQGSTLADVANPAAGLVTIDRDFTTASASLGTTYQLNPGLTTRLMGLYAQRAPEANELFSKGAHEASGTFEIGNPNLTDETAYTVEAGLAKTDGRARFDATGYYTAYDGFIFRQLTGATCDDTAVSCAPGPGGELDQVIFGQRDATFYGVELSGEYDVGRLWNGLWGISGRYDFVEATFTNGENVPRIPPHKLGAGLYYRDASWQASLKALHGFAQNDTAPQETTTPSYTLLNLEVAYTTRVETNAGTTTARVGLSATNLLDDEIRNATSFRKNDVVDPGANVKLFGSIRLN